MRSLRFEDREILGRYLKSFPPQISELTFTNLIAWQSTRPIELEEIDGHLVLKAGIKKNFFFPPIGPDPASLLPRLVAIAPIERAPEQLAQPAKNIGLSVKEERDHWDYVYRREDLAKLEGGAYAEKRNLISRALKLDPEIEDISQKNVRECLMMEDEWCRQRLCEEDPPLVGEHKAVQETFRHFSDLPLRGIAIRVNGLIEAFTVGEPLNPNTFVTHFEKALVKHPGLYQLINQEFARRLEGFEYINREQDLGIEGLRKAKLSYNPHHLVEKFSISAQ